MTHREVRDRLGDYLEGDIGLAQRALLDAHLDACRECSAELESLRNTVLLLRDLSEVDVPVSVTEVVLRRLEAGEGRATWWIRVRDVIEAYSQPRHLAAIGMAAATLTAVAIVRPGLLLPGLTSPARASAPVAAVVPVPSRSTEPIAPDAARMQVASRVQGARVGTSRASAATGFPASVMQRPPWWMETGDPRIGPGRSVAMSPAGMFRSFEAQSRSMSRPVFVRESEDAASGLQGPVEGDLAREFERALEERAAGSNRLSR